MSATAPAEAFEPGLGEIEPFAAGRKVRGG